MSMLGWNPGHGRNRTRKLHLIQKAAALPPPAQVATRAATGGYSDPDHFQPPNAIPFDAVASTATVAPGATASLLNVEVPAGFWGILTGFGQAAGADLGESIAAWDDLTWAILVNGGALYPWGSMVHQLGALYDLRKIHSKLEPGPSWSCL